MDFKLVCLVAAALTGCDASPHGSMATVTPNGIASNFSIHVETVGIGRYNLPEAKVTIRNTAAREFASAHVRCLFYSKDGGLIGEGVDALYNLPAGGTDMARVQTTDKGRPTRADCRVDFAH